MKIRIQDSSVRFRVTLKELEELEREGRLEKVLRVVESTSGVGEFRYALICMQEPVDSWVSLEPFQISVNLSQADLATLLIPDREGVYLRREGALADGTTHRFMAMVEKDRPGPTCHKPEAWIYDDPPRGGRVIRPIPQPCV